MLIIGIVVFVSWRFWDFFSSQGWRDAGDYMTAIEGGNMWYWVGMASVAGVGVFFCMRQVHYLETWWDALTGTTAGLRFSGVAIFVTGILLIPFTIWATITQIAPKVDDGDPLALLGIILPVALTYSAFRLSIRLFRQASQLKRTTRTQGRGSR